MKEELRTAVLECWEEIPCNPCVTACPAGAITMRSLSDLPVLEKNLCTGCGLCAVACPGLAIIILADNHDKLNGTLTIPYEFLPLPEKGSIVTGTDRRGVSICSVEVLQVLCATTFRETCLVKVLVPKEYLNDVRGIKRIQP